ncbi:hypothetical protein FOL47_001625 [Perkinsus chesapeaki]|uniref:Uncharacterized protein n=1 Tax=Perkinsus chesapeaki TaxID=330153 RepID=A0A7J6N0L4_PERCH|nr:hypothetical protein FOL47_001625 [Perkinsus chesapeaki]
MEEINFRVAGRMHGGRLWLGSTHEPHHEASQGNSPPSIPSRLETVLNKVPREPKGFGSEASRFEASRGPDGPGPGELELKRRIRYVGVTKRRPFGHDMLTSDSWSKKGTGSFASKSTRFSRWQRAGGVVPGPGAYDTPDSASRSIPSSYVGTLSGGGRVDRVPESKPGPGHYEPRYPYFTGVHTAVLSMSNPRGSATLQKSLPGPGTYDPKIPCRLEKNCPSKVAAPSVRPSTSPCRSILGLSKLANSDSVRSRASAGIGR